MDLNQLRDIIETEGGKLILLQEGKPPLVVTTLEEYRNTRQASQTPERASLVAGEPQMNFGAQFAAEVQPLPKELEEEPLKIEDLPV